MGSYEKLWTTLGVVFTGLLVVLGFPPGLPKGISSLAENKLLANSESLLKSRGFEKISEKDAIVVYMKEPGEDGSISVRGEAKLAFSPAQVYAILEDNKKAAVWMPLVRERRVLEQLTPTSRIEFTHLGLQWPVTDRYFIDRSSLDVKPDGTYHISIKSIDNPKKAWLVEDKVLGFLHYSEVLLQPQNGGKSTYITVEVHTDPRGAIPRWLVNMEQRQWPRKFLEGLKGQLEAAHGAKTLSH